MGKKSELLGQTFNRLVVVGEGGRTKHKKVLWSCQCICGNKALATSGDLKRGHVSSCGCLQKERTAEASTIHGGANRGKPFPEYRVWLEMKQRCLNVNNKRYKDYGGRGITICDRWLNSFENFLKDMGRRPKGLSIERIENNKGYTPDNCKWATREEQTSNTRTNKHLVILGITYTLNQAARRFEINVGTLWSRLKAGWEPHEAIFTP